jgi:2-polyprenyl-3-methyl-5-hydroxy-6-metoxy-1,4-benzoquinol methylase
MKQNIYDDPAFFEGYQNLRENEAGLNAAIEDPAIMSVLPDLKALSILDLGSGFGDFCRFARKQGAARVVGVEISKRMIAEAENRTNDSGITYLHTAVEDYAMKAKAYDLVVCRLTMHYVSDYRGVVGSVYRGLRAGGRFILSVEHPLCTALGQGWHEDADGNPLFWPVDDYQKEGERRQHWFVDGVIKYHRTVETYINTLLDAGFCLTRLLEPQAAKAALKRRPDLRSATRRPPLLVIAVRKPAGPGSAAHAG